MNFYESMVYRFSEGLQIRAGLKEEQKVELIAELMKSPSCRALDDIRKILDNDELDDESCFNRIEKIVEVYEALGSDGGNRHDFG